MASSPADSGVRTRPSSYLHKACMNCRRRKIRCDGERPVCRRCRIQPPRSLTPCKYSHGPAGGAAPTQLEEMVEAMQDRIHQLERSSGLDASQILLSEPYPHIHQPYAGLDSDAWDNPMHPFRTPSPSIEEPPELTGTLIDRFSRHFSRHQFFLDSVQFRQSALLPLPFGHPDLPPRALLNAVSLWANRVSPGPIADSIYSEEELLGRVIHHLGRDVATIEGSQHRLLHLIQAEVLLSLYYLDSGRFLEGNYHCAGATSLAFSAGLHQLGTSSQRPYPPLVISGVTTPASADNIRAREEIDAFWSVVILNNYFVAVSGIPSNIPCDARISTPWPTYPISSFLPSVESPSSFLDSNDVDGHSPLTLLAKASILLERTIALIARYPGLSSPPEFWDNRLDSFRGHLPPFGATATDQMSLVTHALVNVAILYINAPYNATSGVARFKCLAAASCVAARLVDARLAEWEHADPIIGPLLSSVADFLIPNLPYAPQAAADLQTTLSAMHTLARWSPLIQQCLAATQERYTACQQSLGLLVPT